MQNFSHFMKNNVFSNNAFFGGQLHKNYVFMFSHNSDGIVSCMCIPGFIVQGNMGWRGICHVWTWLRSINGRWDSCCCEKSVLGPKARPKQWRKFASKWRKPAEQWRKFPEISCQVWFVIKDQKKSMRVDIDHLMHVFRSIEICCPSKMLKNNLFSS